MQCQACEDGEKREKTEETRETRERERETHGANGWFVPLVAADWSGAYSARASYWRESAHRIFTGPISRQLFRNRYSVIISKRLLLLLLLLLLCTMPCLC